MATSEENNLYKYGPGRYGFGSADTANYVMDNVECTGKEDHILDCPHATTHDCSRGLKQIAGVVCDKP